MRFICPCCGHRTLERRPFGSWGLCGVCLFEDVVPLPMGGLRAAQRAVAEHGVVDPELAELAVPATDPPPAWWHTLDGAAEALLPEVYEAFGDQDLAGGVSLAEAELIDDYALPARTVRDPPPRGFGVSGPWRELSDEELERYHWCNFSFQDARGLRYHLPAYIRYFLTAEENDIWEHPLLFALRRGHQLEALVELLTPLQAKAVARFLAHLGTERENMLADDAADALRKHWAVFLEPDQRRQWVE